MKTFWVIISVCTVLLFGCAPVWAILGIDDHVPGYDLLVPFFLVSIPGQGTMNTLVVLTEVGKSEANFHCTVYNRNGSHCLNTFISLTPADVSPISVLELVGNASSQCRSSLEIDLNRDGINDHYVGYIMFENLNKNNPQNQAIGIAYLVDLLKGVSAGVNLPSIEVDETLSITDSKLINQDRHTELFSANSMYRAQQYITLPFGPSNLEDANYFRLTPRFILIDGSSNNYWFIWTDKSCNSTSVSIYDEEEHSLSISVNSLSLGLNIIDFRKIVPSLWLQSMPAAGWLDFTLKSGSKANFGDDRQMLAYTFVFRVASQDFSGFATVTETHREAGYSK